VSEARLRFDFGIRQGQCFVEGRDTTIDVLLGDDQGRRDYEVTHPGLDVDPITHRARGDFVHQQRLAGNLVGVSIERSLGGLIPDLLHCPEHAQSVHLPNRWMARLERVQFLP